MKIQSLLALAPPAAPLTGGGGRQASGVPESGYVGNVILIPIRRQK